MKELQSAISKAPRPRERLKSLTRLETVKLRVERAALLFRGAPTAIAVTIVNAGITTAVAWPFVDRKILLGWLWAVLALAILRGLIWMRYRLAAPSGRAMSRFAQTHIFFMAVNGALWGALAPIFAVHGMLDSPFLPFIIAGMAATAVVSAGASWRAVLAFNGPVLAPLAITYALIMPETGFAIAAMVVLFGASTAFLALTVQGMIDRSILLHTHNSELYDALRKQADEAQEAERRFRALVEVSHDLTLIFSPDGKITYASPSAERVLGVPSVRLIGLTTRELVHVDDLQQFRAAGEKTLSSLGAGENLDHVCMKAPGGGFVALAGRVTNMLYVPGVEGFVFNGGVRTEAPARHLHAAL